MLTMEMTGAGISTEAFGRSDFLNSTAPYEYVLEEHDPFLREQRRVQLLARAEEVGMGTAFRSLLKRFEESRISSGADGFVPGGEYRNAVSFTVPGMDLSGWTCGEYLCTDRGVTMARGRTEETVCSHPILPVRRLYNADERSYKTEIAYRLGGRWERIVADKSTVASAQSIVNLAKYGVAVSSENAKALSTYLRQMDSLNYEQMDELRSTGRLGWIGHGLFAPYEDGVIFDGEAQNGDLYRSVHPEGSMEKWLECASAVRQERSGARIALAASFASVLLRPLGALPFFCHIYGRTGCGKTVALKLAASVWADPNGQYIKNFNSTKVGMEFVASFLNSLPMCIDELQLEATRSKDGYDNTLYSMCEGVGRARGRKDGGVQKQTEWRCVFISTGESSICRDESAGGAMNRVIEVDCTQGNAFTEPEAVADCVELNYGHAGKLFVEHLLRDGGMDYAREVYRSCRAELGKRELDLPSKQVMSMAILLTADRLATDWIFQDDCELTADDLMPHVRTNRQIDPNERCLEWVLSWASVNDVKFRHETMPDLDVMNQQVYGCYDRSDRLFIVKSILSSELRAVGFDVNTFVKWAKANGLAECDAGRIAKNYRVNGSAVVQCVCLNMDAVREKRSAPARVVKEASAPDELTETDELKAEQLGMDSCF